MGCEVLGYLVVVLLIGYRYCVYGVVTNNT